MKLKFRAWHENTVKKGSNEYMYYSDEYKTLAKFFEATHDGKDVSGGKSHIMQSTGLTDKNGMEMYFNDLVKLESDIEFSDEIYQVVKDDFGIPCFVHIERFGVMTTFETYFMNPDRNRSAFEVIGNIHQPN